MTDFAAQTQFRQEFILGHETRQSYLVDSVTNEAVIKGNKAVFPVVSSNGEAVTRGINGLIPYQTSLTAQPECILEEWHAGDKKNGFNIFASQGDQRLAMQLAVSAKINRKRDAQIIAQLATATNNTGAAAKGSNALLMKAFAKLGQNKAARGAVTCAITPAFLSYLAQAPEFTNIDYAPRKMFEQSSSEQIMAFRWMLFDFIVHPDLPGAGTTTEKCYMYSKDSIGSALDTKGMQTEVGYNGEQDYSFARATFYGNAKMLQQTGVIEINHDASEFFA